MSLDDWLIALHVLSGFALVGGIVVFWAVIVAGRQLDTPAPVVALAPLSRIAGAVLAAGAVGTIVFGVWLAFSVGDYNIWDPWIVAALVLWVIAMNIGRRTDLAFRPALARARELQTAGKLGSDSELQALNRTSQGIVLHALATLVVVLILVDMIWKPGA